MKTLFSIFTIGIFVFLLTFTANAATEQEYLDWFNKNVALGNAFDPAVVNAYSDDAQLHIVQFSSDGIKQTMEMDGAKWKEMLLDILDLAKQAGDKSEYSDLLVSVDGNQAKIIASRYSVLDCYKDEEYYVIAEETGEGNFHIIEESIQAPMESQCENISDKYLNYVLQVAARLLNKQLPLTVDQYTELEKVYSEGKSLIYEYTIADNVADKINPEVVTQTLKPMLTQQTCGASETGPIVNQGATFMYVYYGKEGNELFAIDINKSDCL